MGWKVVHLTKPCSIKIKAENLLIDFYEDDQEVKLTLRDIDFILFDNTKFTITGKSLELLSKNNIAVLFIDEEFHPSSILIPFHKHSTMSEVAHTQISITKEFKDKIWQGLIRAKIYNQSKVLEFNKNDKYKELEQLSKNVQLYDDNNDEAQAARVYWKNIFNNDKFRREQGSEDIINISLNYAYAILRATMARSVSASGLLPVFGIWHQNRYNAFNLVDDFIEPFRPICDLYIKLLLFKKYPKKTSLDVQLKRDIVALLNFGSLVINGGISSLNTSCELFVKNYKRAMFSDDISFILYPNINIDFFNNECI